ncbi:unnamed protein product [Urochloa decumbens]|uniref:DUF1618 domain-containing protein n=1 Tax=Urochloa decumbens TaxID=240449 RepID=A0ABC9DWF8_9POAL
MRIPGLFPSSLSPPPLSADDDAAAQEKIPYVLLELKAYVAKRHNATTAFSVTCSGKPIQVTFCPRRPPRVSYLCVHCPDAAEINLEPTVLATDEEFVLLSVTIGAEDEEIEDVDSYVYQADGAAGPSLTLLPRPPSGYYLDASDFGILGYSRDGGKSYIVAGLHRALWGQPAGHFTLCVYNEKDGGWKTHPVSLSQQEQEQHCGKKSFYHKNCKVVAIGGDAGTMAFVDLWRGIIFCDVLPAKDKSIILHYVKLPEPLQGNKTLEGDARLYRNIAVIGDRLKYVELQVHYKASVVFKDRFVRNGWMAATWSRPASSLSSDGWHEDNRIMDSRNLKVDNELYFKLLPKVQNDEGYTFPPFMRIDLCQPVLGLGGDGTDIIYFTAKRNRGDANGWVVSVDLENKELLGVALFASQRYIGINFAYMHSRISMHLKSAPGTQGNLKRQGTVLPQSFSKKHSGMDVQSCK